MKLRRGFSSQQLIFALSLTLSMASVGFAQDKLITTTNQTRDGKILRVSRGAIEFQIGAGSTNIPLNQIASVVMAVPAEFTAGKAAYDQGEYAKALPAIKKIVETFLGLPTPWAQEAAGMLGDIYVATGKTDDAEKAYTSFQQVYGARGGSMQSEVGLARIALSKKDYAKARERLTPVTEKALTEAAPAPAAARAYSQAFCLLGQVDEAEQKYPEALENYLRTVTIYPKDAASVTLAQQRADAIRKEHNVAVP